MLTTKQIPESDRPASPRVMPLAITVLAGGPGSEREVSLESGRAVLAALNELGHRAIMSDISADDLSALDLSADCVFIALHGEFGEDGVVQRELERRGIAFCGSGSAASADAMNKARTKAICGRSNIPTPEYLVVEGDAIEGELKWRDFPAFVKPVSSGSSVDTIPVGDKQELSKVVERLLARYGSALVERRVIGPELTVGMLGDQPLPVCQIRTKRDFYDYAAKYEDDDTEYLFEIDLPETLLDRVQQLSLEAHRAVGCEVFSRVDWMIDGETLEPYLLEINTIPGFTSHSLLPKAAKRVGMSFGDLCQRIIDLSLKRWPQINRSTD